MIWDEMQRKGIPMAIDFQKKDQYTMEDLLAIMNILRSPEGCPWDREQTHESIRKNFLEETYEAVEAIDSRDPVLLREELGAVLLQVVQHRAARAGFDFADAYQALECVPRETQELQEAMQGKNEQEIEEELGDLLFSVVNVARLSGLDAEECLTRASDKFIRRFSKVEELAKEKDLPMPGTSMEELDQLWQEVKVNDR